MVVGLSVYGLLNGILLVLFVFLCDGLMCFFVKQKTAYEVRISDWSSDVCSSDLEHHRGERAFHDDVHGDQQRGIDDDRTDDVGYDIARQDTGSGKGDGARAVHEFEVADRDRLPPHDAGHGQPFDRADRGEDQEDRSEEHTSELQSLMHISYAVFCLTQKTQ